MFVRCASIVRLLLAFNAHLEPPIARSAAHMGLHTGDDDSGTLLGAAAFKGHYEIAALLISARADVDGRSHSGGEHLASSNLITPFGHLASNVVAARNDALLYCTQVT